MGLDFLYLDMMLWGRLSHRWAFVFSQPAEKEDVNEGGDKRKNPGKHLRKQGGVEAIHIACVGRSARVGTRNAAGELDLQRNLRMSPPEPIRHGNRKNDQQQRKQVYLALLSRYGLHFAIGLGLGFGGQANSHPAIRRGNRVLKYFFTLSRRRANDVPGLKCCQAQPGGSGITEARMFQEQDG